MAEQGVPVAKLQSFMKKFGLTQKQTAFLLDISDKTLFNLLKEDLLNVSVSDRFLMIATIFQEGVDTFMSINAFSAWLFKPHFHFNKKSPFEIMGTINGAEAVRDELIRTKYGVLS
jgi:putative toxin-antitoxin system antitoxin component (TIGR02293 family)